MNIIDIIYSGGDITEKSEKHGLNDIVQVGTRIRQLRKAKGYKEKDFAKIVGIPYTTYSNYENNNRTPNRSQLEKIASALDVTVFDLMGVSPIEKAQQDVKRTFSFRDYLNTIGYGIDIDPDTDKWIIHIKEYAADIYLSNEEMAILENTTRENVELRISKFMNDGMHDEK